MNVINIIGFIITIICLVIAMVQIKKTKDAAMAAKEAAEEAQKAIKKNVSLTDITVCIRTIEEIKTFLRNGEFKPAIIRTTDVYSQLVQLKHLYNNTTETARVNFKTSLTQLSIIQEALEEKIKNESHDARITNCNKQLSDISKQLNDWLGSKKYFLT